MMGWKSGMPGFIRGKARFGHRPAETGAKWQNLDLPEVAEEHHLDRYQRASRLIC